MAGQLFTDRYFEKLLSEQHVATQRQCNSGGMVYAESPPQLYSSKWYYGERVPSQQGPAFAERTGSVDRWITSIPNAGATVSATWNDAAKSAAEGSASRQQLKRPKQQQKHSFQTSQKIAADWSMSDFPFIVEAQQVDRTKASMRLHPLTHPIGATDALEGSLSGQDNGIPSGHALADNISPLCWRQQQHPPYPAPGLRPGGDPSQPARAVVEGTNSAGNSDNSAEFLSETWNRQPDQQQQHAQPPLPKRHQRPAHREAEMRRLFKIREGVQLLTDACGVQQDRQLISEAATLRECHSRMVEAEQTVVAQRDEIAQLKHRLARSAMPAGQAIDYVQTKWLESPKFELFYKLVGKTVTDAFANHATQERASAETFPDQWLERIRHEEIMRRSARHFGRMRPATL